MIFEIFGVSLIFCYCLGESAKWNNKPPNWQVDIRRRKNIDPSKTNLDKSNKSSSKNRTDIHVSESTKKAQEVRK